jgi:hypothetical protein
MSHFLRITGMMLANDKRLYDNTTDSRILLRDTSGGHLALGTDAESN